MRVEMDIALPFRFIRNYVIGRKDVTIHYVVPWFDESGKAMERHYDAIGDVAYLEGSTLVVKTKWGTFHAVNIDEITGIYDNELEGSDEDYS